MYFAFTFWITLVYMWIVDIYAPFHHFLCYTLSTQTVTQIIIKSMWMAQNWYDIWYQFCHRNVQEIHRGPIYCTWQHHKPNHSFLFCLLETYQMVCFKSAWIMEVGWRFKVSALCSGSAKFSSQLGHWPSWQIFTGFLSILADGGVVP